MGMTFKVFLPRVETGVDISAVPREERGRIFPEAMNVLMVEMNRWFVSWGPLLSQLG